MTDIMFQALENGHRPSDTSVGKGLRYQVTLNAPTTMRESAEETPVTYLNQGQIYSISVLDTLKNQREISCCRYRTSIRAIFGPEPGVAEGSVSRRPSKGEADTTVITSSIRNHAIALEYVCPDAWFSKGDSPPQIPAEDVSVDGFCVEWASNPATNGAYCLIRMRFNILSKALSSPEHLNSKSIKLCASTETLPLLNPGFPFVQSLEECSVRVRLCMENDAEARRADDVGIVKQNVEELEQSIYRLAVESSNRLGCQTSGPGTHLRRRQQQDDSRSSVCPRKSVDEADEVANLQRKLVSLRNSLSAMRPVTILCQEANQKCSRNVFRAPSRRGKVLNSVDKSSPRASKYEESDTLSLSKLPPSPLLNMTITPRKRTLEPHRTGHLHGSDNAVCEVIRRRNSDASCAIEPPESTHEQGLSVISNGELSVEDSLPKLGIKRAACFYVRSKNERNAYHRAIYLQQRTMPALVNGISEKFQVRRARVGWITYFDPDHGQIMVDEDVLRQLPDGQDMVVELAPVQNPSPPSDGQPTADFHRNLELLTPPPTLTPGHGHGEDVDFDFFVNLGPLFTERDRSDHLPEQMSSGSSEPLEDTYFFGEPFRTLEVLENSFSDHCSAIEWPPPHSTVQPFEKLEVYETPTIRSPAVTESTTTQKSCSATSNEATGKPGKTKPKRKTKKALQSPPHASPEDEEDGKRLISLERNRLAAAKCRVRRRGAQMEQQTELREKIMENSLLRSNVSDLEEQVRAIRALLDVHVGCNRVRKIDK